MSQQTVKVIVRVRPLNQKQNSKNLQQFLKYDLQEKQILIQNVSGDNRNNKMFCFDDIFNQNSLQQQLYNSAASKLVSDVIQGYNGTIFAYGQTGSGKTHTMMGDIKSQKNKGIVPRCFQNILQKAKSSLTKQFLVLCSYMEIYNEEIRDLLNFNNDKWKLQLRQSPQKGIFVKDLKKFSITSQEEFMKYLKYGNQNRKTGETLMNSQSSRSHAIFTIYVESLQKSQNQDKLVGSKFNFVDLAGSQRQNKTGSTGDRFIQATKINLSLTALGKVISALVQGKGTFVPYRDSKLTRLLQDSLGGNAKTVMIATVSPSLYNYQETISTLKYASRAKYITNVPIINRDPKDALLLEYENQIKNLRGQLQQIQNKYQNEQVDLLKQQNKRIAKQAQFQKKMLMEKILNLQQKMIYSPEMINQSPHQISKREEKLTFMEQNYKNLEEEVKQMRSLLSELRRKYKNASKQIFQLQIQHQKQKQILQQECIDLKRQNKMYRAALNVLFTQKQLKNILTLGAWEQDKFTLPIFYFKDRHTLAFPCENNQENQKKRQGNSRQKSNDKNYLTMTSLGMKAVQNAYSNQNSHFKNKKRH